MITMVIAIKIFLFAVADDDYNDDDDHDDHDNYVIIFPMYVDVPLFIKVFLNFCRGLARSFLSSPDQRTEREYLMIVMVIRTMLIMTMMKMLTFVFVQRPLRPSLPCLRSSQPDLKPSQPPSQASRFRPGWLGLRSGWMAQRGEQTDVNTYRKSSHSTGLCPLSGPLPCFPPCKPRKCHFKIKVKQGKGTLTISSCL